jgi:hypothetical protein
MHIYPTEAAIPGWSFGGVYRFTKKRFFEEIMPSMLQLSALIDEIDYADRMHPDNHGTGLFAKDQWTSGSVVEGAPTEEPGPDASNARSQRPATRAIGVSRAFACVLNTRGFPQAFYTAPVIHPVRVHKYPCQVS